MTCTTYHCDICHSEVDGQSLLRPLRIETHCDAQNPMGNLGGGHQGNVFKRDEVCNACQLAIASALFTVFTDRQKP